VGRGGAGGAQSDHLDHASTVHGTDRVGSGLSLASLVAEYRALRASVLRLWRQSVPNPDTDNLDDVTRFNEAIDQSLALAVQSFTHRIEESRKLFLAILGHDLRSPLAAITLSAKLAAMSLENPSMRDELADCIAQIAASAKATSDLVSDLIDFTGTSMGVRPSLNLESASFKTLCDEVTREVQASYPNREISCSSVGDPNGTWDGHRLRQVISNLLSNALQHGRPDEPVDLAVDGTDANTVLFSVHNDGEPIPAHLLPNIFNPLVRGPTSVQHRPTPGSIGLGLYIVKEIAAAHGGTASLTSTKESGTVVTIRLPRHAGAASSAR
jgi:signal transduction histidine kinase